LSLFISLQILGLGLGLGLGNTHLGQDEQFPGPFLLDVHNCVFPWLEWLDAPICPFSPSEAISPFTNMAAAIAWKLFPIAELALQHNTFYLNKICHHYCLTPARDYSSISFRGNSQDVLQTLAQTVNTFNVHPPCHQSLSAQSKRLGINGNL
jgi:hypothetical protein